MERALDLLSRGLVVETHDSKGKLKLMVEKMHNPSTGVASQISTEFSALGWNKVTMEYLHSIKQLGTKKLKQIFDEAREIVPQDSLIDAPELSSGRATLCSDEDTWYEFHICLNNCLLIYVLDFPFSVLCHTFMTLIYFSVFISFLSITTFLSVVICRNFLICRNFFLSVVTFLSVISFLLLWTFRSLLQLLTCIYFSNFASCVNICNLYLL